MTGDSCLEEVSGSWLWNRWACSSGFRGGGGGSLIGGHERGGVMLDRLEHLLPIPTGAKMDRWRKNGDTEDREGKKDEVKGEERDKNAQETFSCIMYTDRVSNMVCLSWRHHWNRIRREQVSSIILLFNPSCVLSSQQRGKCILIHLYHSVNSLNISTGSISLSAGEQHSVSGLLCTDAGTTVEMCWQNLWIFWFSSQHNMKSL